MFYSQEIGPSESPFRKDHDRNKDNKLAEHTNTTVSPSSADDIQSISIETSFNHTSIRDVNVATLVDISEPGMTNQDYPGTAKSDESGSKTNQDDLKEHGQDQNDEEMALAIRTSESGDQHDVHSMTTDQNESLTTKTDQDHVATAKDHQDNLTASTLNHDQASLKDEETSVSTDKDDTAALDDQDDTAGAKGDQDNVVSVDNDQDKVGVTATEDDQNSNKEDAAMNKIEETKAATKQDIEVTKDDQDNDGQDAAKDGQHDVTNIQNQNHEHAVKIIEGFPCASKDDQMSAKDTLNEATYTYQETPTSNPDLVSKPMHIDKSSADHVDVDTPPAKGPIHTKQPDQDIALNKVKFNKYLESKGLPFQTPYEEPDKLTGIEQALHHYTALDVLDENNKFICQNCTLNRKELLCLYHVIEMATKFVYNLKCSYSTLLK